MKHEKLIIPCCYAVIVILLAVADALFFNGYKSNSKIIEELAHIGLISVPLLYPKSQTYRYLFKLLLTYWFLRIALFDISYNIVAGLDVNYIGTTDIWNNILRQIKLNAFSMWAFRSFFIGLVALIWWRQID